MLLPVQRTKRSYYERRVGVRVSFELGGKNPGIVFADCDYGESLSRVPYYYYCYRHQSPASCGPVCLGIGRHLRWSGRFR